MKIFYAVQATGNGHISRCMELLPYLKQYGKVDIFLSGDNSSLSLDAPIAYRSKGLSLYYTCNGSLNYWKIAKTINPISLRKEIDQLPVENYDFVINDYDYITAKSCAKKGIPSVNFGHQASFYSPNTPRPKQKSTTGEWLLKNYAPADRYVGLHFSCYDEFITTPIIKKEILEAVPVDKGHITVYLPSYCEQQLKGIFSPLKEYKFEIFTNQRKSEGVEGNIKFIPVNKITFNRSLIECHAIITGGGFETPSEAIHLGKKLMAIPIRGQYEQCCNAAALADLGVMTLSSIDANFKNTFYHWIKNEKTIQMDYSNSIPLAMEMLFEWYPKRVGL
ncbi:MAG TPA: glycosyltransferase family protein [Niabella sp.]|nr:glycosyltransferase family protein [Niabella sp.]HOZ96729.1 glycosyltransferase family protein [Niabella sp.]HQW14794.1 glycosyltransferase family protein [Niabella sp.]HQX19954.1 glycosyltransferase family protein [Niabella sp.]HRB07526.1 glycosyltransferase family protein [Niabella sp.]